MITGVVENFTIISEKELLIPMSCFWKENRTDAIVAYNEAIKLVGKVDDFFTREIPEHILGEMRMGILMPLKRTRIKLGT